jgi:hypothetical protein
LQDILNGKAPPSILYTSAAVNPLFAYVLLFVALSIPTMQYLLCNQDHNKYFEIFERDCRKKIFKNIMEREKIIDAKLDGSGDDRPVFICKINKNSDPGNFFELWDALLYEINAFIDSSVESFCCSMSHRDQIQKVYQQNNDYFEINYNRSATAIIELPDNEARYSISYSDLLNKFNRHEISVLNLRNSVSLEAGIFFKDRIKLKFSIFNTSIDKILKDAHLMKFGANKELRVALNIGVENDLASNDIYSKWLNDEVHCLLKIYLFSTLLCILI